MSDGSVTKVKKMKDSRMSTIVLHNLLIAVLAIIWLIPIVWLLCTSFSAYDGINVNTFFHKNGVFLIILNCFSQIL